MYLGIAILNVFSHFVAFDLWSSRRRYFNRCGNVYRKWLNNELVLCGESRPGYIEIQEENRTFLCNKKSRSTSGFSYLGMKKGERPLWTVAFVNCCEVCLRRES